MWESKNFPWNALRCVQGIFSGIFKCFIKLFLNRLVTDVVPMAVYVISSGKSENIIERKIERPMYGTQHSQSISGLPVYSWHFKTSLEVTLGLSSSISLFAVYPPTACLVNPSSSMRDSKGGLSLCTFNIQKSI